MIKSPMLWGAGLACALGGAVAGNALGSSQPLDRSTIGMLYQSHEMPMQEPRASEPLPDHYPLVTRSGTVPVAELSTRGLYSQARYRALLYAADYGPDEFVADYQPDPNFARYETADESVRIGDAAAEEPETVAHADQPDASPPLALGDGPATVEPEGRAKLIDVKAALAMR